MSPLLPAFVLRPVLAMIIHQSQLLPAQSTIICLLQGWALPLADMKGSDVPVGAWRSFSIPATQLSTGLSGSPASDTNHLRITPTWQTKGLKNVYFVSYRNLDNGDWHLSPSWANQVYVHIYNGDQVCGAGGWGWGGLTAEMMQIQSGSQSQVPLVYSVT
jgi:hypothetical protein